MENLNAFAEFIGVELGCTDCNGPIDSLTSEPTIRRALDGTLQHGVICRACIEAIADANDTGYVLVPRSPIRAFEAWIDLDACDVDDEALQPV